MCLTVILNAKISRICSEMWSHTSLRHLYLEKWTTYGPWSMGYGRSCDITPLFKKITSGCRQPEVGMLINDIIKMLSAAAEPFESNKCNNTSRSLGFRAIFPDVKDVPECKVGAGAVPCGKFKLRLFTFWKWNLTRPLKPDRPFRAFWLQKNPKE